VTFGVLALDPFGVNERLGDLSFRERELVDATAVGDALECSQLSIEELSITDDPKHTIRAALLRELVLKRCDQPPDPRGVRVRRARIIGTLDLTHVEAAVGIELQDCSLGHPVLLENAHLPWLVLAGSCVPVLVGDRLRVDSGLFLQGLRAIGHGEFGAVRLLGAHVTGTLLLANAKLTNETGPALVGDGLQADSDFFLQGLQATGRGELGAVRLPGARVTGQLSLRDAELTNEMGPALHGDGLRVGSDFLLDGQFRVTAHSELGAVQLRRAHIIGQLRLSGAALTNAVGPALHGEWAQVDGGLLLDERFQATGYGSLGVVALRAARIGGQLILSGAELINEAGPALNGDGLQVNGGLFLDEGFRATGHGELGAVRLPGAHVTGQLSLRDAELTNETGSALIGDRIQVDSDLFLTEEFRAIGHGEHGTVRLPGAHIAGQLTLRGARLSNRNGLVLNLRNAEANTIFLPPEVVCSQRVTGRLACDAAACRINLSGFVYIFLVDSDWGQWLHLIARHTDQYEPQPYQQLAAVQKAAGHDVDARTILIAQQQDFRKRGQIGGLPKALHYLWGLFGYGYRINRIAAALLAVLATAGTLGVIAGHIPTSPGHYVAMHTSQASSPSTPCSLVEQIGTGIDRGLPLPTTGIRSRCDFDTTSRRGQVTTAVSWVLQATAWLLATVVVAGYSGLIRKTT
jgi:hypothetical protein